MHTRYRIYEFIIEYTKSNLFPPTVKEIANGVGLKSTSSVIPHLKALVEENKIETNEYEKRAIKLVGYKLVKEDE